MQDLCRVKHIEREIKAGLVSCGAYRKGDQHRTTYT